MGPARGLLERMAADAALNQRSATTSPAADRGGTIAAGAAAAAVAELSGDEQLLMIIKQRMSRWRALELEVGGAWECGAVVSVHWRVGLGF